MTQWTVTKDRLAEPDAPAGTNRNAAGLVGPRNATLTAVQIANDPKAVAFRLYDDDTTLCYEGFLLGDDPFAPLDDFGEPNAGCTSVSILTPTGWQTV